MSVAEYVLSNPEITSIQVNENPRYRSYTSGDSDLENEIDRLRALMVELIAKEQSLTSDIVVEISCLLDLKINEYMVRYKRGR